MIAIGNYIGKKRNFSWATYWTTRSLFFLDGTIITVGADKYFKDRSIAARNFLITGYDFDSTWTKGFPYKSAATISAPAGDAVLIAADINNFLYDAGGTPNEIPVVSLFQNIDYENTIYCRHVAQILDGNGVETYEPRVLEIFMTAAPLSAAEIIKANTYFGVTAEIVGAYYVSKDGNDGNTGLSWDQAWLTLTYAYNNTLATNTIYIRSGQYAESVITKGTNILCGLVEIIAQATFGLAALINSTSFGAIVNGNNLAQCLSTTNPTGVLFNKLYVKNAGQFSYALLGSNVELKNSILNANNTELSLIRLRGTLIVNTCLLTGSTDTSVMEINTTAGNKTIKNSRINAVADNNVFIRIDLSGEHNFIGNKITPASLAELFTFGTGAYTGNFIFKRNYVNVNTVTSNYITFAATSSFDVEIEYNTFILNDTISGLIIDASSQKSSKLNYNIIKTKAGFTASGIGIGDIENGGAVEMTGNSINLYGEGCPIQLGTEGADAAYLTGKIINNNLVRGARAFDKTAVISSHGIFITRVLNTFVKHNKIEGSNLGVTHKSLGLTNTDGAVMYNVCVNNSTNLYSKGFESVNYFNNTVVRTGYFGAIDLSFIGIELQDNAGGDPSINTIVKNNIIVDLGAAVTIGYLIYIEDTSNTGLVSDYNIFYTKNNKFANIAGTDYTFAEWQALGYDAHSILLTDEQAEALFTDHANGDFSLKAGSLAIAAGETLDAAYDDGLDASTNWGTDSQLPVVVTKQQGAAWDIGAYVH